LVTFLDEQIGVVLDALRRSGQGEKTRVIYTSDHGEMLGEHGLWWKSTMYESSVAVPLILSGPDIPDGKTVSTNTLLVDLFPTILDAVGAPVELSDIDLPGHSLIRIANSDDAVREAFSEYHAIFSPSGIFMLRHGRFKYVHYVGYEPQLFDLVADPDERIDLAGDPSYSSVVGSCEAALKRICDPQAVDAMARLDQKCRMDTAGGAEAILHDGVRIPFTPTPEEFTR
jgi:choline-sulfatase